MEENSSVNHDDVDTRNSDSEGNSSVSNSTIDRVNYHAEDIPLVL